MARNLLILATGNLHKIKEIKSLLEGCNVEVASAKICGGMPKVDENGSTFAENAGNVLISIGSLRLDSGGDSSSGDQLRIYKNNGNGTFDSAQIEVDGLNGAPGIYSARYAGSSASESENVTKLLNALREFPAASRNARFKCALCVIHPKGDTTYHEGTCEGRITTEPFGDKGFGYDPVFMPNGYSESLAQLGSELKNRISHRARAIESMRKKMYWCNSELEI